MHPKRVAGAICMAGLAHGQVLAGGSQEAATTATSAATDSSAQSYSILALTNAATVTQAVTASISAGSPVDSPVVAAQAVSSVVSIYFPGADQLPYVASLIDQSNGAQTLAISCGPGVNADTCGFPSSITVTAGPSTAYVSVSNQQATFIYDCKISASTTAVCAETFNGNAAYIESTSVSGSTPGSISSVVTETLASTDITWMPITITATGGAGTQTSATATATGSGTASSNGSSNGNNSWMNVSGSGTASTASTTATSGSSAMTSSSGSGSSVAWSNLVGSGTTVAATSASTSGVNISTFSGAAAKLVAAGNFAAGVLALARFVL